MKAAAALRQPLSSFSAAVHAPAATAVGLFSQSACGRGLPLFPNAVSFRMIDYLR